MSTSNTPAWQASALDAAVAQSTTFTGTSWSKLRKSAATLGLLCIALIAAADWLFYHQPLGWTAALFGSMVAAALALRGTRCLRSWPGRVIAIGFVGICLTLVEHPGPLRFIMAIIALLSLAIINTRGWTPSVPAWIARWAELVARAPFQIALDATLGQRWRQKHQGRASRWLRVIVNWTVPILFSIVFIWLFALANPVISKWVSRAGESIQKFFIDFREYVSFARILLWLIVGLAAWTLLRGRTRVRGDRLERVIFSPNAIVDRPPAASAVVRCLILFNLVFAIQLALDLATVLSHGANLPDGMTYSEYAHRGAYPLVATALLAAAFVLTAFPTGLSQDAVRRMMWARRLVYIWIAQNIILTISAIWRLWMYVDAFGLTRLRVAAAIWMLLVALGLIWIIWRIVAHRTNSWLLRVNTMTLFVVLFICCFINFDSFIASYGIQKSADVGGSGPRADVNYIASLGPEAIPTLDWLSKHADAEAVRSYSGGLADQLRADLRDDLRTWHGWTIRRARLIAADAKAD